VDGFKDGGASYLKLRDVTENASGLRTGTQKLDFVRTTAAQAYGADVCSV
jgi:hypothetical protein